MGQWLTRLKGWVVTSEPSMQALRQHKKHVFQTEGVSRNDPDASLKLQYAFPTVNLQWPLLYTVTNLVQGSSKHNTRSRHQARWPGAGSRGSGEETGRGETGEETVAVYPAVCQSQHAFTICGLFCYKCSAGGRMSGPTTLSRVEQLPGLETQRILCCWASGEIIMRKRELSLS